LAHLVLVVATQRIASKRFGPDVRRVRERLKAERDPSYANRFAGGMFALAIVLGVGGLVLLTR
jgi:hypothetical protein